MAHNPLLGSRISLISKKNIRYEGTLYSINETDATVALENVRSYGTEGRELLDTSGASTFVPPQDVVHAYLLFRGQDIKDLHVHEKSSDSAKHEPPSDPAIVGDVLPPPPASSLDDAKSAAETVKPEQKEKAADSLSQKKESATVQGTAPKKPSGNETTASASAEAAPPRESRGANSSNRSESRKGGGGGSGGGRRKNNNMVGTGASLLNRKARGAKGNQALPNVEGEFDFESNLAEFDKAKITTDEPDEENDGHDDDDDEEDANAYSKDDFFDSISCDALDKVNGIDNRLRGAAERNLNLDTFGAVSLGHGRRGGRRNYRGGRGRGRGRGGGRGRGRGRGRDYYDRERASNGHDRERPSNGHDRERTSSGHDRERTSNGLDRERSSSAPAPRQNNRWKQEGAPAVF